MVLLASIHLLDNASKPIKEIKGWMKVLFLKNINPTNFGGQPGLDLSTYQVVADLFKVSDELSM